MIQEHKEVLTVWERSWYSTEAATKELDVRLGEHLEAYRDLKEHGCAGFQYTTNDDALAKLLAERISALRKEPRTRRPCCHLPSDARASAKCRPRLLSMTGHLDRLCTICSLRE